MSRILIPTSPACGSQTKKAISGERTGETAAGMEVITCLLAPMQACLREEVRGGENEGGGK